MVRDRYTRLDEALSPLEHRVHYTLKANSNAGILRVLHELGAGVDVVSGGELYRARKAGFSGADILFGGVSKTEHELREALEAGVRLINVEADAGVLAIHRLAGRVGGRAPDRL